MAQTPTLLKVELSFDPPGPTFLIDRDGRMPTIRAIASVAGVNLHVQRGVSYSWAVTLVMQNSKVPLSLGRRVAHLPITRVTSEPTLTLPFTKVRGGQLTVSVTVNALALPAAGAAAGRTPALTAERSDLAILGTNPAETGLMGAGASGLMIKIIRHESTTRQFLAGGTAAAGYPLFSQDRQGGVGLTQLTNPRPAEDQIWDWKANVQGGMKVLGQKRISARNYLNGYGQSTEFRDLVMAYNAARARMAAVPKVGMPPGPVKPPADVTVVLPAPTDDQIDRETLRAYNGYGAGLSIPHSKSSYHLHEFTALTDADGALVVDLNADGRTGTASWHENTAADRQDFWIRNGLVKKSPSGSYLYPGDPDYVANVLKVTISDSRVAAPSQPSAPALQVGGRK